MSLTMTKAEREAFLAEMHVAMISIADGERGPLTVPIWYAYEGGQPVRFVTGGSSRKAGLIRRAGRISLCVQTETAPYKYVSIEGPAKIVGAPDYERDVRQIAHRYLGREIGEVYLQAMAADPGASNSILVHVTPERWLTVDYTKMPIGG